MYAAFVMMMSKYVLFICHIGDALLKSVCTSLWSFVYGVLRTWVRTVFVVFYVVRARIISYVVFLLYTACTCAFGVCYINT